ncbi:vitamin B12-dependent ribonucleotide reductase [Candidatus Riflebacteria bacterium]
MLSDSSVYPKDAKTLHPEQAGLFDNLIPDPKDPEIRLSKSHFVQKGKNIYEEIEWRKRSASISNESGETIFKQDDIEAPKSWSEMATNVVASKYFRYDPTNKKSENSVQQLIHRVASTISNWGLEKKYFNDEVEKEEYYQELSYILLNQFASFNSPVWFNCGIDKNPQCSACFINSVEDSMENILELAKVEGMLFKGGSGAGTNLSPLRSSKEKLQNGGVASGPVSFMKGYDAFAGVIKSGGKTRRAAKMVILDVNHPDIMEFISCKSREEKKALALIDAGYDGSFNGEAYQSVFFQNANHAVRVSDEFMHAVVEDREWKTFAISGKGTGAYRETMGIYRARKILEAISENAHFCGDPGIQFDTTINEWHTCSATTRINASNPCSEYMFIDDSACNLASLNLMKFVDDKGELNLENFCHTINIMITAMEIIVDKASYPTDRIAKNSMDYRPLGLGFANLGAYLMNKGIPYDSESGRANAAILTSILTAQGYKNSARLARRMGSFTSFSKNRLSFLHVIRKHATSNEKINRHFIGKDLKTFAANLWNEAYEMGERYGYRNAQISVLAPTGTISFMMDCDTTGIEPDIALIKYKKLVGGGILKIINNTVANGLIRLNYNAEEVTKILDYIEEKETIEGAPDLKPEDLKVFDCALKPKNGTRSIEPMGHVKMVAACQPFLSGAISKTVNLLNNSTTKDIFNIFLEAWKLGLKAIAVYRDGSKRIQPLSTTKDGSVLPVSKKKVPATGQRRKLPDERHSITHKFSIAGSKGYITVGLYPDGKPGEVFIVMDKEGSTVSGLVDTIATSSSIALQYGVPLSVLTRKFSHTRFEPSGFTNNSEIPIAKSIIDYVFRWLAQKFPADPENGKDSKDKKNPTSGNSKQENVLSIQVQRSTHSSAAYRGQLDAPPCQTCGEIMLRNGACYSCINCGSTSGCG